MSIARRNWIKHFSPSIHYIKMIISFSNSSTSSTSSIYLCNFICQTMFFNINIGITFSDFSISHCPIKTIISFINSILILPNNMHIRSNIPLFLLLDILNFFDLEIHYLHYSIHHFQEIYIFHRWHLLHNNIFYFLNLQYMISIIFLHFLLFYHI